MKTTQTRCCRLSVFFLLGAGVWCTTSEANLNDRFDRFPIGFWNAASIERFTPEAVKDWVDAGITVATGPYFDSGNPQQQSVMKAILDRAHKSGIKVILQDGQLIIHGSQLPDDYRQRVQKASAEMGIHPAVLGWHVRDEPEKANFEAVCAAARMIREICPKHIAYVNLFPMLEDTKRRVGYEDWHRYLDDFLEKSGQAYLSYDCYSQMAPDPHGKSVYFENLRTYRDAAKRNRVPFWNIVLSCSHFNFKDPTEDSIRWQFNTSIAYGAQGVSWFLFYMPDMFYENFRLSPIDEFGDRTSLFDSIKRTNRNFTRRYGRLFLEMELQSVGHWPDEKTDDGCEKWSDKTLISSMDTSDRVPMIIARFKHQDGGHWLVLVNNSMDLNTQYRAVLTNPKSRVFEMDTANHLVEYTPTQSGAAPGEQGERLLIRWLAPGQMDSYKLED